MPLPPQAMKPLPPMNWKRCFPAMSPNLLKIINIYILCCCSVICYYFVGSYLNQPAGGEPGEGGESVPERYAINIKFGKIADGYTFRSDDDPWIGWQGQWPIGNGHLVRLSCCCDGALPLFPCMRFTDAFDCFWCRGH
jgi:hypothetical protein